MDAAELQEVLFQRFRLRRIGHVIERNAALTDLTRRFSARHCSAWNGHTARFLRRDQNVCVSNAVNFDVIHAGVRCGADLGHKRAAGVRIIGDRSLDIDHEDTSIRTARILESADIGVAIMRPHICVKAICDPGQFVASDDFKAIVHIGRDVAIVDAIMGVHDSHCACRCSNSCDRRGKQELPVSEH